MIYYSIEPGTNSVRATFCLNGSDLHGRQVSVVGDFNDWDPTAAPMLEVDGLLSATLVLQPGRRYRFHYVADDGEAVDDLFAHEVEIRDGRRDSVLDLSSVAELN